MKNLMMFSLVALVALAGLAAQVANAGMKCEAEAQVNGKVKAARFDGSNSCVITISEVSNYSSNPFCPLSIDEIIANGVRITTKTASDCSSFIGKPVSGIIVSHDGQLVFE